jgi:hypothetical protein
MKQEFIASFCYRPTEQAAFFLGAPQPSEAWKEQSDPIFRFCAEGDWWGFPLFSLSASRYFGEKETLCLYWPLGTVVIAGPRVLDFYAGFCAHRATCLKADGKDIKVLNLILSGNSDGASEMSH